MGKRNSHARSKTLRASKKKKVMFGIRNTVHNKTGNKKKKEEHGIVINATLPSDKKKKTTNNLQKKKDQLFAVSVNLSIKSRTLFFRVISVLHFAEKKTHT